MWDPVWKNESSDVSISSIILRNDNFNEKAAEINDDLARLCKKKGTYIFNKSCWESPSASLEEKQIAF